MTTLFRTCSVLIRQQATAEASCSGRFLGYATQQRFSSAASQNDARSGADQKGSSWMPAWLKSKLPGALGGTREYDELEDLDLDKFAKTLKQARQLGSLTGFVSGSSKISDPLAKGNLRMYEDIIGAMSTQEKQDLQRFDPAAKQRVAGAAGCTVAQVEDCLAKYQWMKTMTGRMAQLKRQGKPIPKTIGEVEAQLGNWKSFKQESLVAKGTTAPAATAPGAAGGASVPLNAIHPSGKPCPLAGQAVGRNTRCPATRKAYKACCGSRTAPAAKSAPS